MLDVTFLKAMMTPKNLRGFRNRSPIFAYRAEQVFAFLENNCAQLSYVYVVHYRPPNRACQTSQQMLSTVDFTDHTSRLPTTE